MSPEIEDHLSALVEPDTSIVEGHDMPEVRVLYVSYTGLLDPLGQSQVLQYVLGLAQKHGITVVSYEKPHLLRDNKLLSEIEDRCRSAGVNWHRLTYHNRLGIPSTLFDIAAGSWLAVRLARSMNVQVVHCRSYIAGIIGLIVKHATNTRFVFDMRGFWPDERVDGGIWKKSSLRYRVFKWIERRLFEGADHVVSLTKAGVREFQAFDYLSGVVKPTSVIPTCTNLELFSPQARRDHSDGFVLGYVGSAGSWYMFTEVARTVRILFEMQSSARFLVINRGDHSVIRKILHSQGVDLARIDIREAAYAKVAGEIAKMDAGIFFYQPVFSKTATSPTRMGEFLACGKPCLANAGVGDVEQNLLETQTGIAIDRFDDNTLEQALQSLLVLAKGPEISSRCRRAAEERFSLDGGIREYSRIYNELASLEANGT